MKPTTRLHNLDYLRGIAASGIMVYHYLSWAYGNFGSENFMGRVGIYGVSIFYILSGLTLYYVYYAAMKPSMKEIGNFFRKRIFRIYPLLWLVTIFSIVVSFKVPNLLDVFLNLSGLFGFVKWDTYFSSGIWSIGNELVFYVFFPFFILFTKSYKWLMILLSVLILGVFVYFAFFRLQPEISLKEQWRDYVNPLNQVFLFLSGFGIGYFLEKVKISNTLNIFLFAAGFLAFVFYPVSGDTIHLITGISRLVFTACCLMICIAFYKMTFTFPALIHRPLTLLGEASYSIYLLHPLVYTVLHVGTKMLEKRGVNISIEIQLGVGFILSLVISYFVYHYFEKYFMRLGKRKLNG